jgi:hypothetical protein
MIHNEPHELAGKTVRVVFKNNPLDSQFFTVEDWVDRVMGRSWGDCDGNPACLTYAFRAGLADIPPDDEVLYGKVNGLGTIVHVSELEVK